MEYFIIKILLAAVGIAIIAGSLGCFVIWKQMSYFSESISHATLLGISLGIVSGFGVNFGLIVVATLFAIFIVILQQKRILSNDTILGILSHIALALGIVVLGLVGGNNIDYFAFLFGDILTVSNNDIIWIYAVLGIISLLLITFWQKLLLITLNEDLAVAEGLNRTFYQLLFMLMIALAVSVSVKIIGILLITSLLIIPPAIAKVFATSPSKMALQSVIIAIIAIIIGVSASAIYDLATGPAIVVVLGVLFIFSQLITPNSKNSH